MTIHQLVIGLGGLTPGLSPVFALARAAAQRKGRAQIRQRLCVGCVPAVYNPLEDTVKWVRPTDQPTGIRVSAQYFRTPPDFGGVFGRLDVIKYNLLKVVFRLTPLFLGMLCPLLFLNATDFGCRS